MKYVNTIHCNKPEYLTPEEFNEKLDYWENEIGLKAEIIEQGNKVIAHINKLVFEANKLGIVEIKPDCAAIAREFSKMCNYHKLDDDKRFGYKKQIFRKKYSVKPKVTWDIKIAAGRGIIDSNLVNTPLKCWSYDLNSSFPAAMLKPMPDTRKEPKYDDLVGPGEIGFFYNGAITITEGDYAEIIFPLMESPFKNYVETKYINKKNSTGTDRTKYKFDLNVPTGILALHNIFLRNAVIGYANMEIEKYIDENTVYSNVDCIVSTKERTDLPIGNEIGEFKQEHYGIFKYKDIGIYQWNEEIHYQGLKGQFLTDINDISDYTTNIENSVKYNFNKITRRFEKRENN